MADGKVTISTALDNSGISKGIKTLRGTLGGLGNAVKGTLGGLTKVVAGVTASITAAFGAAAVAITKQSVDAYADYEQLIGGVKTLFKDGADKVAAYAEDAFYRAGVSANKYMETVTSFSASLISSLGGDTAKAADVADMAMVDMADNANKMGTAAESIRNAYQGFAKQNYTMLDNLKLGYGGTKTEMERLLKDAQAITGVKYDIDNLADVYSAIHAIQEKLGIAGATAEEAEKTISGSAAMTKAAWENVLTAISGGGDLDKAINNLVFSVSKYFENIVPVVQRSLAGIGQLIEQVAPMLVQTVAAALIQAIPSLLNAVYQMVIGLGKGIYQGIVALFSGSGGKTIGAQLASDSKTASAALGGVSDSYKDVADAAEDAQETAKRSLAGFDEIQKVGSSTSTSSADVSIAVPVADVQIGDVVVDGEVVDEATPQVLGAVGTFIQNFKDLLEPLWQIDFGPAVEAFGRLWEAVEPITEDLFSGLLWAYDNVFVPLAAWTIEDLLPAFLDLLSAALDTLGDIIDAFKPLALWLWDSFLEPVAEWTGGVIVDVLGAIADGLSAIGDWVSANQGLLETLAIIVGSLALAWGLVSGAMTIFNAVAFVWNNIGAICTAVTTAFGAAVNFLTSPVTLVTLAIGALIAIVVLLIKNWDKVKEVATKVWNGIKAVWNAVATWFDETVIQPVTGAFTAFWDGLVGFASDAWEGIQDVFGSVAKFFGDIFTEAWEGVFDHRDPRQQGRDYVLSGSGEGDLEDEGHGADPGWRLHRADRPG
ncbi:MAG: hypothetical protein IJW45_00750 [Oscillospiraceae bacterium]|nr:hypothetical protein [Oscillospiraceae bacterium]